MVCLSRKIKMLSLAWILNGEKHSELNTAYKAGVSDFQQQPATIHLQIGLTYLYGINQDYHFHLCNLTEELNQ